MFQNFVDVIVEPVSGEFVAKNIFQDMQNEIIYSIHTY